MYPTLAPSPYQPYPASAPPAPAHHYPAVGPPAPGYPYGQNPAYAHPAHSGPYPHMSAQTQQLPQQPPGPPGHYQQYSPAPAAHHPGYAQQQYAPAVQAPPQYAPPPPSAPPPQAVPASAPPPVPPPSLGPAAPAALYGPFLRFGGYDPRSRVYQATALVVVVSANGSASEAPTLTYRDATSGRDIAVRGELLCQYIGACFWRFPLTLTCGPAEQCVQYTVAHRIAQPSQKSHQFYVPGASQAWRWGFYSCNGFDEPEAATELGGIQPLWRDVVASSQTPLHVMVGGGDQLYNDGVWEAPSLKEWLAVPKKDRAVMPFTLQMQQEVEAFYYKSYLQHWMQPVFTDVLASVPQTMTWDDHDIFDGWGSYPPYLQLCAVFQGIFSVARKYYCLFQQHSMPELIHKHNQVFGEHGWNSVTCLGHSTALVMMDQRTERSREFIVRPASWAALQQRLDELPGSVRHVVFVATVPLVYPQVPGSEGGMMYLAGTGLGAHILRNVLGGAVNNQFGEPELLDDLLDHWSADMHKAEKRAVLHLLQDLAKTKGVRVTIVAGDVHLAAVGRFCTSPPVHPSQHSLRSDHRFMYQIVSSAIGNKPPPDAAVTALNISASPQMVDTHTREKMMSVFQGNTERNKRLKAARNWCLVTEAQEGALNFQLRIEIGVQCSGGIATLDVVAPLLVRTSAVGSRSLQRFEMADHVPPQVGSALHRASSTPQPAAAHHQPGPYHPAASPHNIYSPDGYGSSQHYAYSSPYQSSPYPGGNHQTNYRSVGGAAGPDMPPGGGGFGRPADPGQQQAQPQGACPTAATHRSLPASPPGERVADRDGELCRQAGAHSPAGTSPLHSFRPSLDGQRPDVGAGEREAEAAEVEAAFGRLALPALTPVSSASEPHPPPLGAVSHA